LCKGREGSPPERGVVLVVKGVPAVRAQVQADALSVSFEAPLKEFVRLVRSAKAVMADRGAALSALQHAKADMEMRRGKLLKMRGVPGIKARSRDAQSRHSRAPVL